MARVRAGAEVATFPSARFKEMTLPVHPERQVIYHLRRPRVSRAFKGGMRNSVHGTRLRV